MLPLRYLSTLSSHDDTDPGTKTLTPKSATYRRPFVETNQTARISLQILAMSKSNPETKTRPVRPNLPARRPDIPLNYPASSSHEPPSASPSTVPTSASAAPVKGLLRIPIQTRKHKNHPNQSFFQLSFFHPNPNPWRNFRSDRHQCAKLPRHTPASGGVAIRGTLNLGYRPSGGGPVQRVGSDLPLGNRRNRPPMYGQARPGRTGRTNGRGTPGGPRSRKRKGSAPTGSP